MRMSYLRLVEPDDIGAAAREDRDSVLLAEFDPPLETRGVQRLVAGVSTGPTNPDAVEVRVITYQPEVQDSTALSLDRLSSHTDGSFLDQPPPWFVLSCRRADPGGGGASTFIPVEDVVSAAPSWVIEALATARFRFLKTYDGNLSDSFVGPVLTRRSDGAWLMRWRADHLYRPEPVHDNGTRAADAAGWLHEFADAADPVVHALGDGHLALVPNGRFLHGRTALSPDSRRCILRAWVY
jgi:alpha-ketoglutarate-dependent taurine dioxygenase